MLGILNTQFVVRKVKLSIMSMILPMMIRLLLIIAPLLVFIILLAKRQIKFITVMLVLVLLINSLCMLFVNIRQDNIMDMSTIDMTEISDYYSNDAFCGHNIEDIYVFDSETDIQPSAIFRTVTYKEYTVDGGVENALEQVTAESSLLKKIPELSESDNGVLYYVSDLKGKFDAWNFLYNIPQYSGCIIIADDEHLYYIEYEVELYGEENSLDVLNQIFYLRRFKDKINVMELFVYSQYE